MYSTRINGEATTFGTSGFLYRSNKMMYDRSTRTLWNQLTGKPVIGPLASTDIKLKVFPIALTTWGEWLTDHPDTTVLSLDTGVYSARSYQPESDRRSIYFDYRADPDTMFPIWQRDDRLLPKDEVLGVTVDDAHKAYPIAFLNLLGLVQETVGSENLVIVASEHSSRAQVYLNTDSGVEFTLAEGDDESTFPATLKDTEGNVWNVTDDAIVKANDSSKTLTRYPSQISFWFGWYAFHPDTLFYDGQ